jgi:hypothetical protein
MCMGHGKPAPTGCDIISLARIWAIRQQVSFRVNSKGGGKLSVPDEVLAPRRVLTITILRG